MEWMIEHFGSNQKKILHYITIDQQKVKDLNLRLSPLTPKIQVFEHTTMHYTTIDPEEVKDHALYTTIDPKTKKLMIGTQDDALHHCLARCSWLLMTSLHT
jgi:hypothetical protein